MDISHVGLLLLTKGKLIFKDTDGVLWEFYYKEGHKLLLFKNGSMIGQKTINNVIVLPKHIREGVEFLVCILDIESLQQSLNIPRERISYWKHQQ